MLVAIECILVVVGAGMAFAFPRLGDRLFAWVERRFVTFADHRNQAVILVTLGTLALRIALLPTLPAPEPGVHDEFSYLLAADTFAHGRLANPTHPMWTHFETFHVNQRPTYVSMYYPAQGAFLAFGQVVFGHPIWGVWISTALMCGAIVWMLQGWMAPHWALLGGLLAVVRLGTFSYWMNSYWGGSVAALGGAVILGALPRIMQNQRVRDSVLMALGFALLANSRPYEGLFLSLPVVAGLIVCGAKKNAPAGRELMLRVAAPLVVLFLTTLAGMGYYFFRTTGSAVRTPYSVNAATYRPVGLFPWESIKSVSPVNDSAMHHYYAGSVTRQFEFARAHPVVLLLLKGFTTWNFFIGPVLSVPFFAACFVLPYGMSFRDLSRRTQFLLIVFAAVILAAALPVCSDPHYLAPVTCVFYALVLIAMSTVRRWQPQGRPVGLAMMRAVPVLALALLAVPVFVPALQISTTLPELMTWCSPGPVHTFRQRIQDKLANTGNLYLVIVRYDDDHDPRNEWVYNGADIDHSTVVWARDMGPDLNQPLVRYFSNRKVLTVNPDHLPPLLSPYPDNSASGAAKGRVGDSTALATVRVERSAP